MAEEYFQERTERATPRRREEARREGQVARSREIASAAVVLAMTAVLALQGPALAGGLRDLCAELFGKIAVLELSASGALALHERMAPAVLALIAPLALAALAAGLVSNILQVGFHPSSRPLAPRFHRIDPLRGLRRIVSLDSGVELAKSLAKLIAIGAVAASVVVAALRDLSPAVGASLPQILAGVGRMFLSMGLRVGLALLVLAILDYGYQRWRHEKSLMMTRKEMDEELKQQEGSPHVKARIRSQQRRLSWLRMMAAVPKADVVITNPVHVAVALRYERGRHPAPQVVAKGLRKTAERIRELARRHGVPIVEDPSLARMLHRQVDVGQLIPVELFEAVARVLAYVYRLHERRRTGVSPEAVS